MTLDDIIGLAKSGMLQFDLTIWDALAEEHMLQIITSRPYADVITEECAAALRQNFRDLRQMTQMNMVEVCLSPDKHRASWHWDPVPHHAYEDREIECCEKCADYRKTAHSKAGNNIIT